MTNLIIITKKQADKILVDSLFNPINNHTLNTIKYDCGKYKSAPKEFVGRLVQVKPEIKAIYPVRRKDKDGAYTQLMCLTTY